MEDVKSCKGFNYYYKFLISNFGHADCLGCRALARVLEMYKPNDYIQDLYAKYAEEINATPSAVERSIRVYLNCILQETSIEDMSKLLDYAFKPNQTTLRASEIIPVMKFILDTDED